MKFFALFAITIAIAAAAGTLELKPVSGDNEVLGKFTSEDGMTLKFYANKDGSFNLFGSNGFVLANKHLGDDYHVTTVSDVSVVRSFNHKGYFTIDSDNIALEDAKELFDSSNAKKTLDEEMKSNLQEIFESEEFKLLAHVSYQMGQKGLKGAESKAAMVLHGLAYKTLSKVINTEDLEEEFEKRCEEYPNSSNYCIGMCGATCNCWSWVCGDCCYHQGCYEHDLCCSETYLSWDCAIPLGFSCDSYKDCDEE